MAQGKTKAEAEAAAAEAAEPEMVEMVEFFGPGKEVTIRRLTTADLAQYGMDGLDDVDWRQENNWTVPMEDFRGSIPAARTFFSSQPDFRIVQVEKPADDESAA